MAERSGWRQLRDRRLAEPGAVEAYAGAPCPVGSSDAVMTVDD